MATSGRGDGYGAQLVLELDRLVAATESAEPETKEEYRQAECGWDPQREAGERQASLRRRGCRRLESPSGRGLRLRFRLRGLERPVLRLPCRRCAASGVRRFQVHDPFNLLDRLGCGRRRV